MQITACMRDDRADSCEEGVKIDGSSVEIKAFLRDDEADACEEGVTVVEAGRD